MEHDRMQRQRFEYKYLLVEDKAMEVREFVRTRLQVDEAGLNKFNSSYRVNSIYLDSDSLKTFWDWVNADRNRFKLRMRFYEEDEHTPVFLEIKRRINGCILKQRCAIRKQAAWMIVEGQFPPPDLIVSRDVRQRMALENFASLVAQLQAKPKALVTYLREAYIDLENEGIRVTMDREVRIAPRTTLDFHLHMDRCVQPFGHLVILELKFNDRFPDWFGDMVRMLGLVRSAAAKYCEGMAALHEPELGNWAQTKQRRRPTASSFLADA